MHSDDPSVDTNPSPDHARRHLPLPRPRFVLTYQITSIGWIDATVRSERSWARLAASYMSDAVGDLLGAVAALTSGAATSRCSWSVDPGEYRWLFRQTDNGVDLLILGFGDCEQSEPDQMGTFVFHTVVALPALATWVVRRAEQAHRKNPRSYDLASYEEEWGHPFPQEHADALNGYIDRQTI